MAKRQQGNGSGKFGVAAHDMGGWVRVAAGGTMPAVDELPIYLAHRLSDWLRQHPQFHLLCVVPIVKDGMTVELHGWYEQHLFPDKSGIVPQT